MMAADITHIQNYLTKALWKYGQQGGGDNYYKPGGLMLNHWEVVMAEYIEATYPTGTRILEIGSGYGQLAHLLGCMGFKVQGTECNEQRLAGARWFLKELGARYTLVPGSYPETPHDPFDLVVGANLVNGFYEAWGVPEAEKIPLLTQGGNALLNMRLWWRIREDFDEQESLANTFKEHGYTATNVDGPLWHFEALQ